MKKPKNTKYRIGYVGEPQALCCTNGYSIQHCTHSQQDILSYLRRSADLDAFSTASQPKWVKYKFHNKKKNIIINPKAFKICLLYYYFIQLVLISTEKLKVYLQEGKVRKKIVALCTPKEKKGKNE